MKLKRKIKICLFWPRQIYLEYLGAVKMRDRNFHLKYLDEHKMRDKVTRFLLPPFKWPLPIVLCPNCNIALHDQHHQCGDVDGEDGDVCGDFSYENGDVGGDVYLWKLWTKHQKVQKPWFMNDKNC